MIPKWRVLANASSSPALRLVLCKLVHPIMRLPINFIELSCVFTGSFVRFCAQGVGKSTLIMRVFEGLKTSNPNLKVQGFYTRKLLLFGSCLHSILVLPY